MRREASPHHVAGVAEPVEILGLVAGDARGKNLPLPRDGGNLVAFELADDLQRSVDAVQPRRRRDVLPALQRKRMYSRGGDRLDLAPQACRG